MLQATGLTKKYGEHTALNALNLTINRGEIFCLLGQNGAGKTTTIIYS
jgi:ABC-2 type transport system ATP-binding protein